MSTRSKQLELVPLVPPAGHDKGGNGFGSTRHFLEVEVSYDNGESLFGSASPRGYYLRVTPVTRQSTPSGGEMRGFMLFSGASKMIAPAGRFSDVGLARAAAAAANTQVLVEMKASVIAKHKLVLQETPIDASLAAMAQTAEG